MANRVGIYRNLRSTPQIDKGSLNGDKGLHVDIDRSSSLIPNQDGKEGINGEYGGSSKLK